MVGAAAALLMAPKKGEELRQDLLDLAEEAKKRAQDYCEQVKQNLAEMNAAEEPAPAKKPQAKKQKKEA